MSLYLNLITNRAKEWVNSSAKKIQSKLRKNLFPIISNLLFTGAGALTTFSSKVLWNHFQSREFSLLGGTAITVSGLIACVGAFFMVAEAREKYRQSKSPYFHPYTPDSTPAFVAKELPADKKLFVIFKSAADWNGSFQFQLLNSELMEETFDVRHFKVENPQEITKVLQTFSAKGRKVDHIAFMVHGSANRIWLGKESWLDKSWINPKNIPNLDPEAHVLFQSCSTGAQGGIAQQFSTQFPKTTVYAPSIPSPPSDSALYLDTNGKPALMQFSDNGHNIITNVFHKGKFVDIFNEIELQKFHYELIHSQFKRGFLFNPAFLVRYIFSKYCANLPDSHPYAYRYWVLEASHAKTVQKKREALLRVIKILKRFSDPKAAEIMELTYFSTYGGPLPDGHPEAYRYWELQARYAKTPKERQAAALKIGDLRDLL